MVIDVNPPFWLIPIGQPWYIIPLTRRDKSHHVVAVLLRNEAGFLNFIQLVNLCELVTTMSSKQKVNTL